MNLLTFSGNGVDTTVTVVIFVYMEFTVTSLLFLFYNLFAVTLKEKGIIYVIK